MFRLASSCSVVGKDSVLKLSILSTPHAVIIYIYKYVLILSNQQMENIISPSKLPSFNPMSSRPYVFSFQPTFSKKNNSEMTETQHEVSLKEMTPSLAMMAAWYDRNLWATHDGATGVNPSRIIETSRLPHVHPTMTHQPHPTNFWLNYLLKCVRLHLDNSPRN